MYPVEDWKRVPIDEDNFMRVILPKDLVEKTLRENPDLECEIKTVPKS